MVDETNIGIRWVCDMNEEFIFDDNNPYMRKQYESAENYKVDEIGNGNICYIFFSSNGLVAPATKKEFIETIVYKDRYEWKHVAHSKDILAKAGKIIYIRDISRQFYVLGINKRVNSIDKLCRLLAELTEGMRVVTCGTSSGGYMAVIAGIYLKAECIFSFGGQWSLSEKDRRLFLLEKHKNDKEKSKYYDITHLLDNNQSPIMYFYSALNPGDARQAEILLSSGRGDQVYCFPMRSGLHGYLLFNSCYKKLLTCKMEKLIHLSYKFKKTGKLISLRWICMFILRWDEAVCEIMKDMLGKQKV